MPRGGDKTRGKWGNEEKRVARSLVFLVLEMVMEREERKGVEFGIECSFPFFPFEWRWFEDLCRLSGIYMKKRTDVRFFG